MTYQPILRSVATVLMGMTSIAVQADPLVDEFDAWVNNTHHNLIECSCFYAVSVDRFKGTDLETSIRNQGTIAFESAKMLGLDPRVTAARVKLFAQNMPKYSVAGGYSIMQADYLDKCTKLMKDFPNQIDTWTVRMKAGK